MLHVKLNTKMYHVNTVEVRHIDQMLAPGHPYFKPAMLKATVYTIYDHCWEIISKDSPKTINYIIQMTPLCDQKVC